MLPTVAAQGPPNPKVTRLAWEVLELQITGGWASIVEKHVIVCDHHVALVLIPLGSAGDRTSGQGDLQSNPKQPFSQF